MYIYHAAIKKNIWTPNYLIKWLFNQVHTLCILFTSIFFFPVFEKNNVFEKWFYIIP